MTKQSERLFRNDFLESLTHVHPIVPLLFWSPLVFFLLWRSATVLELPPGKIAAMAVPGLVVWTLAEYLLHRYVFHYRAKSSVGNRLVHLFHGVHHDRPNDKSRLVMPPVGAVIIMSMLWLVFTLVIPAPWVEPFTAFFITGYLMYDYTHYATHHFPMKYPFLFALKRHHLQHHFTTEKARFGVSSPLWDWVFGTMR